MPLALLLSCAAPAPRPAEDVAQRALEARFDALIRKDNLSAWMNRLAARPHHLGSAYDKDNAEWMAARFKEWGYETSIEEFQVLFPTPKTRLLEMEGFKASLEEPALKEDATSSQKAEQLPVYNAYSIDGDVAGELVYVNTGVPKDYEELERRAYDDTEFTFLRFACGRSYPSPREAVGMVAHIERKERSDGWGVVKTIQLSHRWLSHPHPRRLRPAPHTPA